jgi:O-antigen/teichoic acid export membrane protein
MKLLSFRTLLLDHIDGDPVLATLYALAKDSLVYLIGAAMIGLGNFVLVPLYTRALVPAEFAVYALVDIAILILVTITQLGLGVSYLKWFAQTDPSQQGELLTTVLAIGTVAATIGGGALALTVSSRLGEHWLQTAHRSFSWILLPIVVLENLQGLLLADLRARRRAIAFSVSTVVRLLVIVTASLWFVARQGQGVPGVFLGRLVGDAGAVLLLVAFCLRYVAFRFSLTTALSMVRYGLPIVWGALVGLLLDASGRYFLAHYSTMDQVGYYALGIKVSNMMPMLIVRPFGIVWGGLLFQIASWPNARVVYSKILNYVSIISMTVALILTFLTPMLFSILATADYAPAMGIFPILLLVHAVRLIEYPAATGIYLREKTPWFIVVFSVGLGANLLANYILVPNYGMLGASVAWLLTWVVIVGFMMYLTQRFYPLDYDWRIFGLVVLIAGLVVGWKSKTVVLGLAAGALLLLLVAVGHQLNRSLRRNRL